MPSPPSILCRWRFVICTAGVLCFLVVVAGGRLGAAPLREAEFKAATLSKIIPYVSWPRGNAPLVVGLYGGDPFSGRLHVLLRGQKTSGGRPIVVRVIKNAAELPRCQVVFIPAGKTKAWASMTRGVPPKGQLTVGETTEFVKRLGGICNLAFPARRLEINRHNARRASVKVSSRLLKIATLVEP